MIAQLWAQEVSEGVAGSEGVGEPGGSAAGTKKPDGRRDVARVGLAQEIDDFGEPARKVPRDATRTADTQVDAPRVECAQDAEDFGDLTWLIAGQEHAAGADAQSAGVLEHAGDHDLEGDSGEARGPVVFGDPEAVVSEALGAPSELEGGDEGLGRRSAGRDRGLVEYRQAQSHEACPCVVAGMIR
jgi:hypothetical protein